MGMTLVRKLPFPDMQFTPYYLAAVDSADLKNRADSLLYQVKVSGNNAVIDESQSDVIPGDAETT